MRCSSCEFIIEEAFKKINGVAGVRVKYASARAEIECTRTPSIDEFNRALKAHGYTVSLFEDALSCTVTENRNTKRDYFEIGAIVLIIVGLYFILKQFNIVPKSFGVSENMSYGIVFLIGLVAASSTCIAVTGGLLLALSARFNERNRDATGMQKFKPHLFFNCGRIISYTVLGGAVGALGSIFTLSPRATGVMTIIASIIMIVLGFKLLKLFQGMWSLIPRLPRFFTNPIQKISDSDGRTAPLVLGALTFFVPCGFTQALQLYVLSLGDTVVGAFTMFFFALGTMPALISLGAVSSFAKGSLQKYFMKTAGVVVILLGFFNINSGLALAGSSFSLRYLIGSWSTLSKSEQSPNPVPIVDGMQRARMKIEGLEYTPSVFTVVQGVPIEWEIDGREAVGCAQVITMPTLGLTIAASLTSVKKISFTPRDVGRIPFMCSMGMTDPNAAFIVVPNTVEASVL